MSATDAFFDELESSGAQPLIRNASGTIRFDLQEGSDTDYRLVSISNGEVRVQHKNANADVVVRVDRAKFDSIASGEMNATAALLRGDVEVEGDLALIMSFQRLFPAPPKAVSQ